MTETETIADLIGRLERAARRAARFPVHTSEGTARVVVVEADDISTLLGHVAALEAERGEALDEAFRNGRKAEAHHRIDNLQTPGRAGQ